MADSALDPVEEAPVQDAQSVDASKPGLQNAWKQFTNNPANNAALLQFGIAMLQPRGPGQSAIGAAANAVGEAGGAASRATQAQAAEDTRDQQTLESQSKIGLNAAHADAARTNADAYTQSVQNYGLGAKASIAAQKAAAVKLNSWVTQPDFGMPDPVLEALKRQFPGKTISKTEVLTDPQLRDAAKRLFLNTPDVGAGAGSTDDSGAAAAPATVTPPSETFRGRQAKDARGAVVYETSPNVWVYKDGRPYKAQ